jgi:2'-5' RNA ligase
MASGRLKRKGNQKETIRAFIAVPIPVSVLNHLGLIQSKLKASGLHLRWVKQKNIHITLKFFGEIEMAQVSPIAALVDQSVSSMPTFELQSKGVGVFPSLRRPRVVWAGLSGDLSALQELHASVNNAMTTIGFDKEKKKFQPHLTLARCRGKVDGRTLEKSLRSIKDHTSGIFVVKEICMFQSLLTPAGATYALLHRSQLG